MLAKHLQSAMLQARTSIEREHEPRHDQGAQNQLPVCALVGLKITGCKALRQRHGLTESQTETFPGDGIDSSSRVADQRHIPTPHSSEAAIARDRASFRGN